MVERVVVGIDVRKAKLDVAILPGGEQFTVSNEWCWKQPASLNSWRSVSWLPPGCR
jgi:hypothetical protein